jgi:hypothetical protein
MLKTFFILITSLLILSCNGRKQNIQNTKTHICIVDSIYERQISSIEFERSCFAIMDCGTIIPFKCDKIHKGDTLLCPNSK